MYNVSFISLMSVKTIKIKSDRISSNSVFSGQKPCTRINILSIIIMVLFTFLGTKDTNSC